MDINLDRRVEFNAWLVVARWFYIPALFALAVFQSSVFLGFQVTHLVSLSLLALLFLLLNVYLRIRLSILSQHVQIGSLRLISLVQIFLEIILLLLVFNFGLDRDRAGVFFILPVLYASLLFGRRGAVLTALLSGLLVSLISTQSIYYDWLSGRIAINNGAELWRSMSGFLSVTFSYLVTALFSSYALRLFFRREQKMQQVSEEFEKVSDYRKNEWQQLQKTTNLLISRDRELVEKNLELDKKIKDLERSEKAMLKAFSDLKEERKISEEERSKTSAIVSSFADPVIFLDQEGRISLINKSARLVFGLSQSDLGKQIGSENYYSMENFRRIIPQEFALKKAGELKSERGDEEELVVNISGTEKTYKVTSEKVLDAAGNIYGTMKIFYDLTREKMIDKLKSEFISIAAHQLRTPLSAIKWVIEMVLAGDAGPLSQEQIDLLLKGYQSNERIIKLVNDMLNVSRIEEGRFGYVFAKDDLAVIVNNRLDDLAALLQAKSIKVEYQKPDKLPFVYMDRSKIELVIQNLMENAVKYTQDGGIIKMSLSVNGPLVRFSIRDNGVGIPLKDQAKLFGKFFRAANVMRMQTEGSGLGLFMVKNIIKKHGGEISFSSEEGKGSEFIFTLPIEAVEN